GAPWLEQLQLLLARRVSNRDESSSDQGRIFEQYADLLSTLATRQPLLIILDDLHWGDLSSISLLNAIARRIVDKPIMMAGAYRPEDVAQGRDGADHPLTDIINEIKRRAGDIIIDLTPTEQAKGRAFIDALLDAEPNQLDGQFRHQLVRHTGGHPLFTIELLRDLQERKHLYQNEQGQWLASSDLAWDTLPARVEGVIEKRMSRLAPDLREILTTACIEGEPFTAEVIAQIKGVNSREVVRYLNGELDRQHRLVQEQGVRRAGSQRLSLYSFRHKLFQKYLYDSLGQTERMYLHEDVGNALEALYQNQTGEIATQLARHFQEARLETKAVGYLLQAGEQAARLLAFEEAIPHLKRGLELLDEQNKSPDQIQQQFDLQIALGKALWKTGQVTTALETFERAADVARTLNSPKALALAALGYEEPRWRFNLPPTPVIRLLEEALAALGEEDSALRARVLANLARTLLDTGLRDRLATTVKQAIEIARRINDSVALYEALRISVQVDRRPEIITDRITALDEMVQLAKKLDDRERLVIACGLRLYDHLELGEIEAAETDLNTHVELGPKMRQVFSLHASEVYQAMWAMVKGRFDEAEHFAEKALEIGLQMGAETVHGTYGLQMFTIRREQGRLKEIAPVVKLFVAQNPAGAAWRPGLALIYSDLGLRDECRATFELLAADDFTYLPQDSLWLTCIVYLAEVCAFLDDANRAAILYQLLLPYNGRVVVVGSAVACYGAVSRYLGLLAATMSDWETAEQHFEDALALNLRLDAPPWLAHTQQHYASTLLARGRDEDYPKAMALLNEALVTAQALGMYFLAQKAAI
ncbi:MAG: hypothetical protein KDJ65_36705, partial [Anaerolineae bacterium]|nr:hypothetical protein [Anaerolineae bacterium]